MIHSLRVGVLIAGLIVIGFSSMFAQMRWGSAPVPSAGVCFYQDINFGGQYFCARPGESFAAVPPGTNDQISSIRVFGNAEAMVFKDGRFRGPSALFGTDARDLRRQGWNDVISSARVTTASIGRGGMRPPIWGNQPMPREGACFYKDANFRGQYFCVPRGGSYELVPPGFNDQISSVRVMGSTVMVFPDRDYSGRGTRLTTDVPNLRGSLGDSISSVRVF
jgi:hypothetical protein